MNNMTNCPCEVEFVIGDEPTVLFDIEDNDDADFEPGDAVIAGGTKDYEKLNNLPTVNGLTIIGDQTVAYYLQYGLIIDGGSAEEVL